MAEDNIYPPPKDLAATAHADLAIYRDMYIESVREPERFWAREGKRLDWIRPYSEVKDVSWSKGDTHVRWFADGALNVCANCIDRHLPELADTTAIIFEADDPSRSKTITYSELYSDVCRFANVLRARGVAKGDRVVLYLPTIPEAAIAMLACARIGAVHAAVSIQASAEALADRLVDCGAVAVVTVDAGLRSGERALLKSTVDDALARSPEVKTVIIVEHADVDIDLQSGRDVVYGDIAKTVSDDCPYEDMDAEDPLCILYRQSGPPLGAVHAGGGYLVWASMTHEYIFDYKSGEVYWCASDAGRAAAHAYVVFGPLANGATTLVSERTPTEQDAARVWSIIDTHDVASFCTSSTAIAALMRGGDAAVRAASRKSLKLLGTLGPPIGPDVWTWYRRVPGEDRLPIVDVWIRPEAGGAMIAPLPGAIPLKPGSATLPFFGVALELVGEDGRTVKGAGEGRLRATLPWPGQMRTYFGDHDSMVEAHVSPSPGKFSIDAAVRRDEDGFYWINDAARDVV